MILGLDISTSIVGVAVLDDRDLILSDHWDISKLNSLFEKAEVIGSELWQLRNNYNIEHHLNTPWSETRARLPLNTVEPLVCKFIRLGLRPSSRCQLL